MTDRTPTATEYPLGTLPELHTAAELFHLPRWTIVVGISRFMEEHAMAFTRYGTEDNHDLWRDLGGHAISSDRLFSGYRPIRLVWKP